VSYGRSCLSSTQSTSWGLSLSSTQPLGRIICPRRNPYAGDYPVFDTSSRSLSSRQPVGRELSVLDATSMLWTISVLDKTPRPGIICPRHNPYAMDSVLDTTPMLGTLSSTQPLGQELSVLDATPILGTLSSTQPLGQELSVLDATPMLGIISVVDTTPRSLSSTQPLSWGLSLPSTQPLSWRLSLS
jgi:hypothetical protein